MQIKEIRLGTIVLPSNVLMAPLAGYTSYPFRMLCYTMGAGLCYTEMVSCNGLKYKDKATERILYTTENEKIKAVQLLGGDPGIMGKMASSEALKRFDILDINMGCPVPNVLKSGEGSALMGDLKRASELIKACKKSGKIVTVKSRTGLTQDSLITAEFARMCEDSGADMLTIHGRSRNMMYSGEPDYAQIEQAKSVVSIPLIANGGIESAEDASRMMDRTGADGVMIARYGLENPFIFSELTKKIIETDKRRVLLEQLELSFEFYDETRVLIYIKKLVSHFMKKRRGTKQYKLDLYRCGNVIELKEIINKIFTEEKEGEMCQTDLL